MKAKFKKVDLSMRCFYCGRHNVEGIILFSNGDEVPSHASCAKENISRIKNLRSLKIKDRNTQKASQARISDFAVENEAKMPLQMEVGA